MKTHPGLESWGLLGFVAGAAIPVVGIWHEFHTRVQFARSGGIGESADWGEPLFYMVLLGVIAGLIGAFAASVIALVIRWLTRPE